MEAALALAAAIRERISPAIRRLATVTRRPAADQQRLINGAGTEIDRARRRHMHWRDNQCREDEAMAISLIAATHGNI